MKMEIVITPQPSPYGEDALVEVIRSPHYRVVIRLDGQCWELQARPSAPYGPVWRHFCYTSSRATLERVWMGLHGTCARHCWPELSYLPAIFGGGG